MIFLSFLLLFFNLVFQIDNIDPKSVFRRTIERSLSQTVLIEDDYIAMSEKACSIFISELKSVLAAKEQAVVMLPTGGTYFNEGCFYDVLRTQYKDSIDWNRVIFFNLDEYVDIAPEDEHSYNYQLKANMLNPLEVRVENIFLFDGVCEDLNAEIISREALIEEFGGIDICLLGVGVNGHIGFNEPGSTMDSKTRVVGLSEETRVQNAGYFESGIIPDSAITVGIATILSSKVIVLLGSGESKAEAVRDTLNDIDPILNPASFLNRANNSRVFYVFDNYAILDFEKTEMDSIEIEVE